MRTVEYIVIDTSEQGTWMRYDRALDLKAEVGQEGSDRVALNPQFDAAAWVNDVGHLKPEDYPRNVFGSCVLATLGAPPRPYAGPIVITGWDRVEEITDVDGPLIEYVIDTVRYALGIDPDPEGVVHGTAWARDLRKHAESLKSAPAPTIQAIPWEES
ncbi:hypothetical protein AB0I72_19685 [Nocardiopsis sp. NPDC049922]|uniref:hypothetical protein n=1 Tax=Nocardiopsis sp. NPDC049922 TaxID=3155157 RepID=UPI0033F92F06